MFKKTPSLDLLGIKYVGQLLIACSGAKGDLLLGLGLRTKGATRSHLAGLLESSSQQHHQRALRLVADRID